MHHPIIQDLSKRYTCKKYDATQKISANDMAVIQETLRLSASSINSQPWKFVILESDAAKQRFYDTFAKMHQFNQPHAIAASHIILFAHDPYYTKEKFKSRLDAAVIAKRLSHEKYAAALGAYSFAQGNTDSNGYNGVWTRSQVYLALGNLLHTLARLGIDSTPMEGIDTELVAQAFANELDGHVCEVALAMGYHMPGEDYNHDLPKSRLALEKVITVI